MIHQSQTHNFLSYMIQFLQRQLHILQKPSKCIASFKTTNNFDQVVGGYGHTETQCKQVQSAIWLSASNKITLIK